MFSFLNDSYLSVGIEIFVTGNIGFTNSDRCSKDGPEQTQRPCLGSFLENANFPLRGFETLVDFEVLRPMLSGFFPNFSVSLIARNLRW